MNKMRIKNKIVKCPLCKEKVECDKHGVKYIKYIIDMFDNPVYYCEKCVIEYKTVFGAIIHMHNPFEEYANEFDEALQEFLEQQKHE
jgi:hypothetical protein